MDIKDSKYFLSYWSALSSINLWTVPHCHTLDLVISNGSFVSQLSSSDLGLSDHQALFFSMELPNINKSNQIKSLLLSHHHSTSALVSEILMSVLQTVQKKQQQQFTYGQTVQKKQQTIYLWTDSAKKQQQQFTYGQTVQKKPNNLHMDRQCKKKQQTIYIWTDSAKKNNKQFTYGQTVQKKTTIYIWTVHIYRLYRRQCAKYTYT